MLTRWAVFETGTVTMTAVHVCEHTARAEARERTARTGVSHEAIEQIISSEHVFREYTRLRRSMRFRTE
jgi:hypothetical protein